MKILRRKLSFLLIYFPLAIMVRLCGDDSELPAYARQSLNSRGRLSMAVEKQNDSLILGERNFSGSEMLEDLSFNVDASQELKEDFSPGDLQKILEEAKEIKEEIETPKKKQAKSSEKIISQQSNAVEQPDDINVDEKNLLSQQSSESQILTGTGMQQEVVLEPQKIFKPRGEIIETPVDDDALEEDDSLIEAQQEEEIQKAEEKDEEVVFNFENADLSNLIAYIESLFEVKFIPDDTVKPVSKEGKSVEGHKISFKTQKPLTKQQAWSLFLTFLDMAGLAVVPEADPLVYRIVGIDEAQRSAIPSFIGIDSELLPDNDTKIRYVYFVQDTPIDTLKTIVASLKSSSASVLLLQELKAFIITDNAYNIKSLMRIIRELDKVSMPQAMSVLKLKRVDAAHVESLYKSLTQTDQPTTGRARLFGPRRSATTLYFPENARMIVEPRTNSLILLGTAEDIKKIEEFVVNNIDVDAGTPYSPLHVYQLKYADAATVANIMNDLTKFGMGGEAAKVGGVRGDDKFIKPMSFTPEQTGNRLVVRGDYEDFLKAKAIIEKIDEPQPQVAIEVLILSIGITDIKELGAQVRNKLRSNDFKDDGLLGKNINFQTSGIRLGGDPKAIVQRSSDTGAKRLLGDIISLVTGATAGNTILSLGSDDFGVWGIFHALKTVSNVQVVSNPFLMATNKTQAKVSLGEIRNVETATIEATRSVPTYSDKEAKLEVNVTPQINSDGMIVLKLTVSIVEFRDDATGEAADTSARTEKIIDTHTIVADKEVLALGGLIKNKIENGLNKTPVLGNIPLLGWLFKNKRKSEIKEDLLILLSARIVDPRVEKDVDAFTEGHVDDYKSTVDQMQTVHLRRDPIDRAFFADPKKSTSRKVDTFIFKRAKKVAKREQKAKRKQKKAIVAQNESPIIGMEPPVVAQTEKTKRPRRRSRRLLGRAKNRMDQATAVASSENHGRGKSA